MDATWVIGGTHMLRITEIVIDSLNPAVLARFWAGVLTEYEVRPYDDAELASLAERGLTPATDPAVAVDGPGPTLFFQRTDTPKAGRNRIHFDLKTPRRETEVERLTALGATVRDVHDEYTVMLDPEGNEFCILETA